MPPAGSLSSVVSGLVRAQLGTSASAGVTDADLDRHVADLILKEAKAKAERAASMGIRAYLPSYVGNALILSDLFSPSISSVIVESRIRPVARTNASSPTSSVVRMTTTGQYCEHRQRLRKSSRPLAKRKSAENAVHVQRRRLRRSVSGVVGGGSVGGTGMTRTTSGIENAGDGEKERCEHGTMTTMRMAAATRKIERGVAGHPINGAGGTAMKTGTSDTHDGVRPLPTR
jgi:hypothetical protein